MDGTRSALSAQEQLQPGEAQTNSQLPLPVGAGAIKFVSKGEGRYCFRFWSDLVKSVDVFEDALTLPHIFM